MGVINLLANLLTQPISLEYRNYCVFNGHIH